MADDKEEKIEEEKPDEEKPKGLLTDPWDKINTSADENSQQKEAPTSKTGIPSAEEIFPDATTTDQVGRAYSTIGRDRIREKGKGEEPYSGPLPPKPVIKLKPAEPPSEDLETRAAAPGDQAPISFGEALGENLDTKDARELYSPPAAPIKFTKKGFRKYTHYAKIGFLTVAGIAAISGLGYLISTIGTPKKEQQKGIIDQGTKSPTPIEKIIKAPIPEATPEVTPKPEPEVTPKPEPEITPKPEITPEPVPKPEPEVTPKPIPEPKPKVVPTPKPKLEHILEKDPRIKLALRGRIQQYNELLAQTMEDNSFTPQELAEIAITYSAVKNLLRADHPFYGALPADGKTKKTLKELADNYFLLLKETVKKNEASKNVELQVNIEKDGKKSTGWLNANIDLSKQLYTDLLFNEAVSPEQLKELYSLIIEKSYAYTGNHKQESIRGEFAKQIVKTIFKITDYVGGAKEQETIRKSIIDKINITGVALRVVSPRDAELEIPSGAKEYSIPYANKE